jgi:protein SCO1
MIDATFSLIDHCGRPVTAESYRGRWLLVFFGFTHCKVVCPRNLAKLTDVLDRLGEAATNLVPLYISVDPSRDTPERMRSWLGERYPRFTGLTGDQAAIDAVRAGFRVFAQRRDLPKGEEGYDVPHSALTFLIDRNGRYRSHFSEVLDAEAIVERIHQQLSAEIIDA